MDRSRRWRGTRCGIGHDEHVALLVELLIRLLPDRDGHAAHKESVAVLRQPIGELV
jgi:hypothetical protein